MKTNHGFIAVLRLLGVVASGIWAASVCSAGAASLTGVPNPWATWQEIRFDKYGIKVMASGLSMVFVDNKPVFNFPTLNVKIKDLPNYRTYITQRDNERACGWEEVKGDAEDAPNGKRVSFKGIYEGISVEQVLVAKEDEITVKYEVKTIMPSEDLVEAVICANLGIDDDALVTLNDGRIITLNFSSKTRKYVYDVRSWNMKWNGLTVNVTLDSNNGKTYMRKYSDSGPSEIFVSPSKTEGAVPSGMEFGYSMKIKVDVPSK